LVIENESCLLQRSQPDGELLNAEVS